MSGFNDASGSLLLALDIGLLLTAILFAISDVLSFVESGMVHKALPGYISKGIDKLKTYFTPAVEATLERIDPLADVFFRTEQKCFQPVENVLGMQVGEGARAFFSLAPIVQFALVLPLFSGYRETATSDFQKLYMHTCNLYFIIMLYFGFKAMSDLDAEIYWRETPDDTTFGGSSSLLFSICCVACFSFVIASYTTDLTSFHGFHIMLSIMMTVLLGAFTIRYAHVSYIFYNERKRKTAVDKARAQQKRITKLESTIEGLHHQLYVEIETAKEKEDAANQVMLRASKTLDKQCAALDYLQGRIDKLAASLKSSDKFNEQLTEENWTAARKHKMAISMMHKQHAECTRRAEAKHQEIIAEKDKEHSVDIHRAITNASDEVKKDLIAVFKQREKSYLKAIEDACVEALTTQQHDYLNRIKQIKQDHQEDITEQQSRFDAAVAQVYQNSEMVRQRQLAEKDVIHTRELARKDDKYSRMFTFQEQDYTCRLVEIERAHANEMTKKNEELARKEALLSSYMEVFQASKRVIRGGDESGEGEASPFDVSTKRGNGLWINEDEDAGTLADDEAESSDSEYDSESETEYEGSEAEIIVDDDTGDESMEQWSVVESDPEDY